MSQVRQGGGLEVAGITGGEDGESLDHGGDSSGEDSEMQTEPGISGQATERDVRESK